MSGTQPFRIEVDPEALADLRSRLAGTRYARPAGVAGATGWEPSRVRELVEHWADGYDWRAAESRLNRYPQFLSGDEKPLHFVHLRATSSTELPVLLLHGWPSSFVEMLPLAERLAATRDVVIPSLPGFLFSAAPAEPWTRNGTADRLDQLMTETLGYSRYTVFGGDIGGTVAAWLGAAHAESVAAIHLIHPPYPAGFEDPPLTAAEQAFLDAEAEYDETDGGYSAIMITRPDTISAALVDSPAGLLAWIADKWRDWSDCDGDLSRRLPDDDLLTLVSLYWLTGCIDTSMRQYVHFDFNPPRPLIEVPVGFTISSEPGMAGFPRSIAERACSQIVHWSEPGRGGHFLAWEEPELMASELRATFDSRR